jgi:hypothetical protein
MCRSEIISACRTGEECTDVGVKVAMVAGDSKFTGKMVLDDSVKVTDKGALGISGRDVLQARKQTVMRETSMESGCYKCRLSIY